jgi:hypothetical protein
MNRIRDQWRVAKKLFGQSAIPGLLAMIYAGWEFSQLSPDHRNVVGLIRSWGVTFFLIMWFVGQWLRTSKQISDNDRLRDIKDSVDKSLDILQRRTQEAVAESPIIERSSNSLMTLESSPAEEEAVARILKVMSTSPKAALMLLSAEIEREVRRLLWSSGWIQGVGQATVRRSIEHLVQQGTLSPNLGASVKDFLEIRNRLVHGNEATDDEVLRGIDIGLTILRAVLAVPIELNHVYDPGIDVYEDAACTQLRPGIRAVVLETTSPDGTTKALRFFPTTRHDYQKGQRLSWEWNSKLVILESWVRRPDTGVIELAWKSAAEFVGRNLDDV